MIRVATNDCSDVPTIFDGADVAVITKIDLAAAASSEGSAARTKIREVALTIDALETSRTGAGMHGWIERIEHVRAAPLPRGCQTSLDGNG